MTKNNAFKKTIRAYMEDHDLSYTEARKILDEQSYLQGTGSITLIIGAVGVGKTTALRQLLASQTLPTAVLNVHEEELAYFNGSFVGTLRSKEQLQNLVAEKKYAQYAIDDFGELLRIIDEPEYVLDSLPQRANLIVTLHSTRFDAMSPPEPIEDILNRLDALNWSQGKLSHRVKLVKYITLEPNHWGGSLSFKDRVKVTDYHL